MRRVLLVVLLLDVAPRCRCRTDIEPEESIFHDFAPMCDKFCGELRHQLCRAGVEEGHRKCSPDFKIYDVEKEHNLKHAILMGINGLRDRIAGKMQIANMNILKWDAELSLMAKMYLSECKAFERNPCLDLGRPGQENIDSQPRYYHVTGSYGIRVSQFFPINFVPSIFKDWYYQKNQLSPPTTFRSRLDDLYGNLTGDNDFIRMAYPQLSRIGCGVARLSGSYILQCHFFPFTRHNFKYSIGEPATNCIDLYPLKGLFFKNLCTDTSSGSERRLESNQLCILLLILTGTGCSGFACKGVRSSGKSEIGNARAPAVARRALR